MADQLITGTTLVEKESRSIGDIAIGGILEFDDTYTSIPENFVLCDGATITDPLSSYNGSTVPDLNTNYWTCHGQNFNLGYDGSGFNSADYGNAFLLSTSSLIAPVNLPNGAIITECVTYGSETDETWTLMKRTISTASTESTMATAAINTTDTTITSATIDNSLYAYYINTSEMVSTDIVYGAKITYTPRFKFIIRIK